MMQNVSFEMVSCENFPQESGLDRYSHVVDKTEAPCLSKIEPNVSHFIFDRTPFERMPCASLERRWLAPPVENVKRKETPEYNFGDRNPAPDTSDAGKA